jgi:hypothetical protein
MAAELAFETGETILLGADHEACSGGETTPGVMGGWVCPCECHQGVRIDGPLFPAETLEKALDPTLPPGVVRVDGQPMPLVEFPDDPEHSDGSGSDG